MGKFDSLRKQVTKLITYCATMDPKLALENVACCKCKQPLRESLFLRGLLHRMLIACEEFMPRVKEVSGITIWLY